MNRKKQKNINNIIPFGRSSQFYFNRAMQEYEKGNLTRVKELLELSAKYNKDDIWNYYNLALTLEELEDYKGAIKVWKEHVLKAEDLATEAYFHLALCYSEIEELSKFREYLDLYLEVEDDQEMKDVAIQIMNFLEEEEVSKSLEKAEMNDSLIKELDEKISSFMYNHDYKKALDICFEVLDNEGRSSMLLNKAALIALLAELPEVALELIEEVLEIEDQNIGAMSNLALYYYYLQDEVSLQKIIDNLDDFEFYLLKELLTWTKTLGIMGKHNRAYSILQQVYWDGDISVELCYQLGVASLNLEKLEKTKTYWRQAALMAGIYSPAELYYQLITRTEDFMNLKRIIHYNYEWPLIDIIEHHEESDISDINPEILLIAMKYYIKYGTPRTVDFIQNLIGYLEDEYKQEIVQEILLSSYDSIKYEYLKAYNPKLKNVYNYTYKGKLYILDEGFDYKKKTNKSVLNAIDASLERYKDPTLIILAKKLWYAYCNYGHPNLRRINKEEVWVGAIAYITLYLMGESISYEVLSKRYNVQAKSIQRAVDDIKSVIAR
ncbi:MAG: tetratricopeptide repeat protein [Clostridia bacterium]